MIIYNIQVSVKDMKEFIFRNKMSPDLITLFFNYIIE